jgi:hypothetical protein
MEHHGSFALAQVALHVDRSPMLARRLLQEEGPLSRPLWLRVAAALQIVQPAVPAAAAVSTAVVTTDGLSSDNEQQQQLFEVEGQLYTDDFEAEGAADAATATGSATDAASTVEEATAAVACIQLPPPPPERTAAVKLQALVRGRRLYRVFCQQRACSVVIQVSVGTCLEPFSHCNTLYNCRCSGMPRTKR